MDAEPTYFSLAYTDLPTSYINAMIYTGLYRVNNKLAVLPDMATALPVVSADGLTWTVTIKPGIKWQNGDDFTSADVKFTFDLAASKNCTFIPAFLVTDLSTIIMPQKAVMASFATFQAAAGKTDAAKVAKEAMTAFWGMM